MKDANNLSSDIISLLVLTKGISSSCNSETVTLNHLLLGFSILTSPVKSFFKKFDITSEYVNEKLFNSSIDVRGLVDKCFNKSMETTVCFEPKLRYCFNSVVRAKCKTNSLVYPEDLFSCILKSNDIAIKKAITLLFKESVDVDDTLSFIKLSYFNNDNTSASNANFKYGSKPINSKSTQSLLDYGADLNKKAKEGKINHIYSRTNELNRLIEILGRKDKNNPCLIGEPGVGKTAIVEELALRIVENNVPDFLKNKTIISLDIASLLSGTKYRGDLEERIKFIIDTVISKPNIILFIDEIHNIVASGGSEGSINCANLLKPYLARGEIKCIGATTFSEYKQYIESDSALCRRLQSIQIAEPSIECCLYMLKQAKSTYEKFHNITINDDALESAVKLSSRYICDRYLPDKAFDLIDEACAMKKISSHQTTVTKLDIAEVLYRSTGIPVDDIYAETSTKALKLKDTLLRKVIGQDEAITSISKAILRSNAGFKDVNRPIASFVFDGSTGVGKTFLAKMLALSMFGTEDSIIRIDMSECMEKHDVSKLIGSAPGYVGFGEGGQLTEAVKRNPYSIVLFDEIEKAHPDVINIFLQILDNGSITDGEGRQIDFKNTIIIFTSNLYNPYTKKTRPIGFPRANETTTDVNYREEAIKSFEEHFSPEFVNRLDDIIVFNQLNQDALLKILDLLLNNVKATLKEKNILFSINKKSKEFILSKCNSEKYGARQLKRLISTYIEDELSVMLLSKEINAGDKIKITSSATGLKFTVVKSEPTVDCNIKYRSKKLQTI